MSDKDVRPCPYCRGAKQRDGWHDCDEARQTRDYVESIIAKMHTRFGERRDIPEPPSERTEPIRAQLRAQGIKAKPRKEDENNAKP